MKKEIWWNQNDEEENNNLRSMLLYLIEVLRRRETESYESACQYVVDIFQTYGIDPSIVNNIIKILIEHLSQGENDPLSASTVRTLAQFMIERKNIIISLLEFTLKCPLDHILRYEAINAIKFITDVNSSEDIDLVLNNMHVAHDAAEDSFSLRTIIDRIKHRLSQVKMNDTDGEKNFEDEVDALHPLLKKISEDRWFPRDNNLITLDYIIDVIISKLPNATKSLLKTLTTYLVQLDRVIGFSNEQFHRVSNALISLLSHMDADYRLLAATILGDFGRETKDIDIALLTSFVDDQRVLVRTQSCDTLKRLTSITSDSVIKDCADDIEYLKTLPEEGFSLQHYLNEKNRVPTPPPNEDDQPKEPVEDVEEENIVSVNKIQDEIEYNQANNVPFANEDEIDDNQVDNVPLTNEDEKQISQIGIEDSFSYPRPIRHEQADDNLSRTPSPKIKEPITNKKPSELPKAPTQNTVTPSVYSSHTRITPIERGIRVEINDRTRSIVQKSEHPVRQRREVSHARSPGPVTSETPRSFKQRSAFTEKSVRTPGGLSTSGQSSGKRHLLPDNPEMWKSYAKQNEIPEENSDNLRHSFDNLEEKKLDPIQSILDDHQRRHGYFRPNRNRPVLIPHKISFDTLLSDQVHITVNRRSSSPFTGISSTSMRLTDLNRNKRHLHDVEFVQLLSSLVIRSTQLHKRNEKIIPGLLTPESNSLVDFTDALSISQMQLHPSATLYQSSFYIPKKLPPIDIKRPSSSEMARIKSDAQTKATRTGVNLHKAKAMEDSISNLLKPNREPTATTASYRTPASIPVLLGHNEVTHAWILDKILKSQGASDSQNYIQQILRAYPKFTPLLYSRVPQHLIPLICNDPVIRQLASIITNKQNPSTLDDISIKSSSIKTKKTAFNEENSSNFFDYDASSQLLDMQKQREEQRSELLPPVRGVKMHLPCHVVKFGFRELDIETPEESIISLRDESISKTRRRRIYMHLMCNHNRNNIIHEDHK